MFCDLRFPSGTEPAEGNGCFGSDEREIRSVSKAASTTESLTVCFAIAAYVGSIAGIKRGDAKHPF